MEILGKILGSPARVKIMRLFLLNPDQGYKSKDVAKRSRIRPEAAQKELRLLSSVGFIKKRGLEWHFSNSFKYTEAFEDLLVNTETVDKNEILSNFKKVGKLKLLVISGMFIKDKDSRADLLVVGDKLNKAKIEEIIRRLEDDIGAELNYAIFETKEFVYRLNMYDKLVRDILDFPHEVILETKELSTHSFKKA